MGSSSLDILSFDEESDSSLNELPKLGFSLDFLTVQLLTQEVDQSKKTYLT